MRYLWSSSAITLASALTAVPFKVSVPSNSPMIGSNSGSRSAARAVTAIARADSVHAVRIRTLRNMVGLLASSLHVGFYRTDRTLAPQAVVLGNSINPLDRQYSPVTVVRQCTDAGANGLRCRSI